MKALAYPPKIIGTPTPDLTSGKTILNCFARQSPQERGRVAFTLAEVLITLGIIGVVAALTLQTLVAKYQMTQYKTGFKKTLSVINQTVNINKAKYGFDFSSVSGNCLNYKTDKSDRVQSMCAIFNTEIKKANIYNHIELKLKNNQLYYSNLYANGTTSDTLIKEQGITLYFYQMADGSFVAFHSQNAEQTDEPICSLQNRTLEEAMQNTRFQKYCVGWIDVNGIQPPNKEVRCEDGKAHSTDLNADCVVPNDKHNLTDVFPVVFYDSVVAPASAAAKYVLYK